jgi:hypothetical protein
MGNLCQGIKTALGFAGVILVTSCGPSEPRIIDLLAENRREAWSAAGIPDQGAVRVTASQLEIDAGKPMSGARFSGWVGDPFPATDYRIEYSAMRTGGRDIFGMVTFPVGDLDTHATFVIGGWGGTVTGISNIDFSDANENQTRGELPFENDRWYHVTIEVRPDVLRAWVDDRLVVNVSIKGRHISLRPGYVDHCLPFGFATWGSSAALREIRVTKLLPEL